MKRNDKYGNCIEIPENTRKKRKRNGKYRNINILVNTNYSSLLGF